MIHAPLLMRRCRSFEAGRRECEPWALRYEEATRKLVAAKLQWIQDNFVRRGMGRQLDPRDVLGPL